MGVTRGAFAPLARRVVGELRDDVATRELYACDASLYRRVPRAVLRCGHVDGSSSANQPTA